jgi:hypothetical protein
VNDERRWYHEQVRTRAAPSRFDDLNECAFDSREAFSALRFKTLDRTWKRGSDRVLEKLGGRSRRCS